MCLAVPGRVTEISGDEPLSRTARVDFSGSVKHVSLACVPEARVGDYVLVHVGVALSVLDAAEAAQVFEDLRALGDLEPDVPATAPPP